VGGALTVIMAASQTELAAAVSFYGVPPASVADAGRIAVPLLCHFAADDEWCTPQVVDEFATILARNEVEHELYRYDARHAFFNEFRPEDFEEAAAEQAWRRTLRFLRRVLS
jgi:carboxymethylenebutenolidase